MHRMAILHLRFMVAAGYAKQTNGKQEYVFIKNRTSKTALGLVALVGVNIMSDLLGEARASNDANIQQAAGKA